MKVRTGRVVVSLVLGMAPALLPAGTASATGLYSIAGVVADEATGSGISGICVFADATPGAAESTAQTRSLAGGVYRLMVPAGEYLLHFIDCRPDAVYVSEWYGGSFDRQHATPVTVRPLSGSAAAVANMGLRRGAAVSGTVVDQATGAPVQGICVVAYGQNIGQPREGWPATATASDGTWSMVLFDAKYLVNFRDCRSPSTYAPQWWNGKATMAAADVLTVQAAPNQQVTGINAALYHPGTITGRVTDDATGQPLSDICVGPTTDGVAAGHTDANGDYAITGLPPGDVKLSFSECEFHMGGPRYAAEWYGHQPTRATSTPITVTASNTTVVDETMLVGGTITGRVTDATTGQALSGVQVSVLADDTESNTFFNVGADGTYTLSGLFQSDHYVVQFYYPTGGKTNYQEQWWDGATSRDSATFVSARFNETVSGIDAAMQPV